MNSHLSVIPAMPIQTLGMGESAAMAEKDHVTVGKLLTNPIFGVVAGALTFFIMNSFIIEPKELTAEFRSFKTDVTTRLQTLQTSVDDLKKSDEEQKKQLALHTSILGDIVPYSKGISPDLKKNYMDKLVSASVREQIDKVRVELTTVVGEQIAKMKQDQEKASSDVKELKETVVFLSNFSGSDLNWVKSSKKGEFLTVAPSSGKVEQFHSEGSLKASIEKLNIDVGSGGLLVYEVADPKRIQEVATRRTETEMGFGLKLVTAADLGLQ